MSRTFRTLRTLGTDLPIHWQDANGTHACEGSDVHPGLRLLWTLCEIDVPANAAYLPLGPDPVTCIRCKGAQASTHGAFGDSKHGIVI